MNDRYIRVYQIRKGRRAYQERRKRKAGRPTTWRAEVSFKVGMWAEGESPETAISKLLREFAEEYASLPVRLE